MTTSRWGAVVAVVALAAAGCAHRSGDEGAEAEPHAVVDVQVDTLRVATVASRVQIAGATQALREETVGAPITGRVAALTVLEGDRVQPAGVVARIETEESAAALRGAERLVDDAGDDAARAKAQQDLDRARAGRTWVDVRAPFDGVVAKRELHEGEWTTAGAPILTVVDLGSLVFVGRVPGPMLGRIHPGQDALLRFPAVPGRVFRARVDAIAPAVDPESQTAAVRCRILDARDALRAGLFGSADVVVGVRRDVLCAPVEALRRDDESGACDLVEAVGDSLAVARPVQAGVESDGLVEVAGQGLRRGVHVVSVGAHALADSTRIRVVPPAPVP